MSHIAVGKHAAFGSYSGNRQIRPPYTKSIQTTCFVQLRTLLLRFWSAREVWRGTCPSTGERRQQNGHTYRKQPPESCGGREELLRSTFSRSGGLGTGSGHHNLSHGSGFVRRRA